MVSRVVRRQLRRAVPLAMVAGLLATAQVEDYAGYEGQTACATQVQPGTEHLARHLTSTYGGSNASLLRACTSGASEHKDGRAVDWSADANNPRDVARVEKLLRDLRATDGAGNENALARRMGIMYVIWDDQSYNAYRGFEPVPYVSSSCRDEPIRKCSPTLRHRDHVHISLSHAGGAAQTGFYRDARVPSLPVFKPGTRLVDPERTQLVTTTVAAREGSVRLPWRFEKGQTYRMLVVGRIRNSKRGKLTNGACQWNRRAKQWRPSDKALRIGKGYRPWKGQECVGGKVQVLDWRARRNGKLLLTAGDDTPRNNRGRFAIALVHPDLELAPGVLPDGVVIPQN